MPCSCLGVCSRIYEQAIVLEQSTLFVAGRTYPSCRKILLFLFRVQRLTEDIHIDSSPSGATCHLQMDYWLWACPHGIKKGWQSPFRLSAPLCIVLFRQYAAMNHFLVVHPPMEFLLILLKAIRYPFLLASSSLSDCLPRLFGFLSWAVGWFSVQR